MGKKCNQLFIECMAYGFLVFKLKLKTVTIKKPP